MAYLVIGVGGILLAGECQTFPFVTSTGNTGAVVPLWLFSNVVGSWYKNWCVVDVGEPCSSIVDVVSRETVLGEGDGNQAGFLFVSAK